MNSGRRIPWLMGISCSLLVLLCGTLSAQDSAGAEADDRVYGPAEADPPAERLIYLPFEQLGDVLDQQGASVIIPYSEYLRLWSQSEPGPASTGADVTAVITSAQYVATVEQDIARIQAELVIQVVGKPWVEVPVSFGDAAVGSVSCETGEALLRGTGDGEYALLLKEPGEQRVHLELTTRVVTSPDGREIAFSTPTVSLTTLELIVPQPDQEIEIRPRLVQLPAEPKEGQTRVKASLGATGNIAAKWHARASLKPQMDLLASVTNLQQVTIADGLIHSDAYLEYDVLRGELEQVRIALPLDQRVLDVDASSRIEQWERSEEEGQAVVTIDLLAPATEKLSIEVHTESRLGDGDVAVAGVDESGAVRGIHALDVVRESGQLVVDSGDDLTLRVTEQSGLARIEIEDVAEKIRQEGALAYKFFSRQFTLTMAATPVEPRVTIEQTARLEIRDDQALFTADVNALVERAGVFDLSFRIPDGLDVTGVDSEQMSEFRVEDDLLVVVLRQRMTGAVAATVRGELELPEDGTQFDLPLIEPVDVQREQGRVLLLAGESVEIVTNEEELEAALPDALGAASGVGFNSQLRASWRFTRRPVRIPVTVTRKPARLSAEVATDVDVQPTRTRVTTLVDFLVEYAGLDTFRIDVPESALPTLQIEAVASDPASPALRETNAADPVDGYATYTLIMQRPVTGQQRFRLTYELQPTEPVDEVPSVAEDEAENDADPDADAADAGDAPDADATNDADGATDSDDAADQPSTDDASSEEDADSSANSEATTTEADDEADADPPAEDAESDEEESEAEDADVERLQSTIVIVRPLGLEATDDEEATDLTSVTGEVRLTNEESLTITAAADGADVEPIDVRELRLLEGQGTLAFRYRRHAADETITLTVTQARYDVQEMLATVVSRALVEIVLGDDPTATFRCRYRIKSTERQRLEVRLPKGMELLSAFVNETEVRLEPNPAVAGLPPEWDSYFVNVARSGDSDETFQLALQFLLSFSEPPFDAGFLTGLRGHVTVLLPQVGGSDGTAATQELRTNIWVPREYALIGDPSDPSGFVLDGSTNLLLALLGGPKRQFPRSDDDEWVGLGSSVGVDFPTSGRHVYRYSNLGGNPVIKLLWWETVWVTMVVSGTLALIAWILLRTDWENKLGVLLLFAFGAVLLGLKDMHWLAHALSAMRFGLAFMIGLWVIHGLFGSRHHPVAETPPGGATGPTAPPPAVPPPGVIDHFLKPGSGSESHDA